MFSLNEVLQNTAASFSTKFLISNSERPRGCCMHQEQLEKNTRFILFNVTSISITKQQSLIWETPSNKSAFWNVRKRKKQVTDYWSTLSRANWKNYWKRMIKKHVQPITQISSLLSQKIGQLFMEHFPLPFYKWCMIGVHLSTCKVYDNYFCRRSVCRHHETLNYNGDLRWFHPIFFLVYCQLSWS